MLEELSVCPKEHKLVIETQTNLRPMTSNLCLGTILPN